MLIDLSKFVADWKTNVSMANELVNRNFLARKHIRIRIWTFLLCLLHGLVFGSPVINIMSRLSKLLPEDVFMLELVDS